jgi:biotin synthase
MSKEEVVRAAKEAKASGARRFCIVTSGKRPGSEEIKKIADMVGDVRKTGLLPCATLGLLGENELEFLKDSGLERYHNNSETSRRFYPEICSTHSYDEKMRTVEAVRKVGLSLCSGGIFGMGETWEDRVDMAFALKETGADSIPINFLNPIMGTRLEGRSKLPPLEALRTISLYRFILPDREIRVCGGRLQTLGEFNSLVFMAGADGLLTGNYLTTSGRDPDSDLALIREYGLRPA